MLPTLSSAIPPGKLNVADVAEPPSPLKPPTPVPATVVTIPVLAVTFTIVFSVVEIKRFPAASMATPIVNGGVGKSRRRPNTVDMIPDDALAADEGVGASMGVAAVGDPVPDDAGVNVGARVTAALGITSEYVTFLRYPSSQK